MKIGIVGMGFVGSATKYGLERGHEIIGYDKYKQGYNTIEEVAKCEVIFICVPTPMEKSGKICLDAIEESIDSIYKIAKEETIIVIKSTAVSGTTNSFVDKYPTFNFSFNPEFLTQNNANEDFINTDRIIIGVNKDEVFQKLKQVYEEAKFTCPIIKTDIKSAEFLKYVSNTFLATKVIFANEIYKICEKLNINYDEVIKNLLLDKRIGKSHWQVPGPDGDFGMGSKCFPKDLNALIYLAKENGFSPRLLEEVWRRNLDFRTKIDWLDQIKEDK